MIRESFVVVAIDGGAASGKSTTANELAKKLNLLHIDTGSHYRAVCHVMTAKGIDANHNQLSSLLEELALETLVSGNQAHLCIEGKELAATDLRSREINDQVSHFAAKTSVRNKLLNYQRGQKKVALQNGFSGLVMEGRDIGSVVFPEAEVKVFLKAEQREREKRRSAEGGIDSIGKRDELDTDRKNAPLSCPDDAFVIDTVEYDIGGVVSLISELINQAKS